MSERVVRVVGGVAEGVMGAVVWGVVLGPVMGRGGGGCGVGLSCERGGGVTLWGLIGMAVLNMRDGKI